MKRRLGSLSSGVWRAMQLTASGRGLSREGFWKSCWLLWYQPEEVNGVEEMGLGYRLAKRYWGQGLASESVQAVLHNALNQKQLSSVVVIIEPENVASLKVAEKAGFSAFDNLEFHGRPVRQYRLTQQ